MSTRGLVCVVANGDYKVAQYNHFDSYVDGGLGEDLLNLIKNRVLVSKINKTYIHDNYIFYNLLLS